MMRTFVAALLIAFATVVAACGDATPSPTPAAVVATPSPSPSPTARPTPTPTPSPTPSPTPTASPSPTATSTETSSTSTATRTVIHATKVVRYFKVYGSTPSQLLDSAVANSKAVCRTSDTLACVRQRRVVDWDTVTSAATEACTITGVSTTLKSTVYLPRWVKPSNAPKALVTWWGKMSDHFVWHENQHIAIEKRYEAKLAPLFIGKACSTAKTTLKKWGKSVDTAQAKFDAKDLTWQYPAYP